ncbi:cell division protein FtsX [Vibrio sp. 10N.286.49.C2]|uniref:permease-like cell division protein FtsX n=1 Tax=unclassified Vibrio TaxID=2614977 RepID=UPI000C85438E|nr:MULTISPECIES: permease-like cell division protein FtsX [unclassified Vibrio]PMH35568.1 cell division protein FtsX [Vibrio sp. 10N.286.49.C2]PMH49857.1 cell division protein FtsX [Vibrio sp. 10N.286.49.B1]PMH81793.1 cell division protein FtsX [Vibrio sp. 10N.286.48.B7]
MVFKRKNKQRPKKQRLASDGFFAVHWKQAKFSLRELWQRPLGNLLTLAVISMALTMPACLYLLGKNVASAAGDVTSHSQVTAYITTGVPDARVLVLKDAIESWEEVKEVEYITPQQGLAELSEHSGLDQAISLLDGYALPGVLVIEPANTSVETDRSLVSKLRTQADVTDIRRDEDWLSRFDAIKTLSSTLVMTLSVLMLASVFLIVGNTLRFNVLANKEAIQTMKLIGATDSYILRPYLYSGMWFGFLGALVAWLLTALITIVLNRAVTDLAMLYDSDFRLIGLNWDETLIILMIGVFLGVSAARISAKRHLKEIEPV